MLPKPLAAAFDALRFRGARTDGLRALTDADWKQLFRVCDAMHLTLPLEAACSEAADQAVLPNWVREHMARSLANTRARSLFVASAYTEIQSKFGSAGLPFVVLKGFANSPEFVPDSSRRVQYDLDFLLEREHVRTAAEQLQQLGYEPIQDLEAFPTDHLPVLVRKSEWEWRGDYYDPDVPISVDLHFRLWDEETEGFAAPSWEEFWGRRIEKHCDGLIVPAFSITDTLGYHCLHLLRHALRGSLRLGHVHELGYFLHHQAKDDQFWRGWLAAHPQRLRQLQAITFGIAQSWFANDLSQVAQQELAALAEPVRNWLQRYSLALAASTMRPNKHELWLHLALLDSWTIRRQVFMRRVFPAPRRGPSGAALLPRSRHTWQVNVKHEWRLAVHQLRRLIHHIRVTPGLVWHGAAWIWRLKFAGIATRSAADIGRP